MLYLSTVPKFNKIIISIKCFHYVPMGLNYGGRSITVVAQLRYWLNYGIGSITVLGGIRFGFQFVY